MLQNEISKHSAKEKVKTSHLNYCSYYAALQLLMILLRLSPLTVHLVGHKLLKISSCLGKNLMSLINS